MSLFSKIFGTGRNNEGADIQSDVMKLVQRACRQNGEPVPPGATDEQIDALAARSGIIIPEELRARLRAFGGFETEGGYSLLGVGDPTKWGNIDAYLDGTPAWRERGWIPISSDGCGNHDV